MRKLGIAIFLVLLTVPLLSFAQQSKGAASSSRTVTLEGTEKIKGELEFPQLEYFGKRQSPNFPTSMLDLKPIEVIARVPKPLIETETIERVPLISVNEKSDFEVAK